jgi:cell division protein FtsI/penicillin-binding protein 2/type II secretory pathway pseudopilin PulG
MPVSSWSGRGRSLAVAAVVLVLLAVAAVVVLQQRAQRADDAAAAAARAFAEAAEGGDLSTARLAGTGPAAAQEAYSAAVSGLGEARPEVEVAEVSRDGDAGTARLRWAWPFGPDGWRYETRLALADTGDGWAARFDPTSVHPELGAEGVLSAGRTAAERAPVLGRDGSALVTATPVVDVGVQPSRATDVAGLSRTLAELLDVDAAGLEQRIAAAAPDAFVPVITLRRSDYEPLRGRLQPLPGTVFREGTLPLAPTREFARALLGAAGPATAEIVEQSQGRLVPGDVAGLSGLQRTFDERLAGTAGVRVELVQGEQRTELFAVDPVPGEPLQVSLDAGVQRAADAALAGAGGNGNAALVAVDVASGDVLAVANAPAGGGDRALTGRYPPGSTLKAVSTYALLGTGLDAGQPVGCPPTATVDGRSFRNFEGGALGEVPFRTAFAQSCNTAFVGLSERLEPGSLAEAGSALGLGTPWQAGVDVFAGEVPQTTSAVDLAAATIGQGRTLVSPAAMAQVAATIARGGWAPARVVLDPAPAEAPAAPAADAACLAVVRDLMRQVVLDGTAGALADVPGEPVHAKTGTAEFGTESPPRTHAWTIGFRGSLAFAVLVEEGSSGGAAAVPVVEAFLRGL